MTREDHVLKNRTNERCTHVWKRHFAVQGNPEQNGWTENPVNNRYHQLVKQKKQNMKTSHVKISHVSREDCFDSFFTCFLVLNRISFSLKGPSKVMYSSKMHIPLTSMLIQ